VDGSHAVVGRLCAVLRPEPFDIATDAAPRDKPNRAPEPPLLRLKGALCWPIQRNDG
jgi:hypothetical protein